MTGIGGDTPSAVSDPALVRADHPVVRATQDSPRSAISPAGHRPALIIIFPAGYAVWCRVAGRAGTAAFLYAVGDNDAERGFRRRRSIEMMKT
ncbi:MAG TPA: hypothetical protein VGD53_03850 [Actinoallomurus sp.]|jgi:hypothetical protein